MVLVKKILFFLSLLLFASFAFSFSGSGGNFEFDQGVLSDRSESTVSAGVYSGDVVLNESRTGTWGNSGYLLKMGVYFDQNRPTVSISAPTSGSTKTSSTVTLTYTGSSLGNPIKKYMIQLDSNGWIDNDINLTRTFTGVSNGTHTFAVVAIDIYDVNATDPATVTFTVNTTTSSSDSSTTSSTTSGAETGGNPGGKKETSKLTAAQADNPTEVVKKVEYGTVNETSNGIEFSRNVSFQTIKTDGSSSKANLWRFDVSVKNNTSKDLKNAIIREKIPKEVAKHVSEITFREEPSAIINPDPEVEWFVEYLNAGEEKQFMYFVGELKDRKGAGDLNVFFAQIEPATITAEEKKEAPICRDVDCDDDNICTIDTCNDSAKCTHTPRDGLRCAQGMVCKAGLCTVEKQQELAGESAAPQKQPEAKSDNGIWAAIAGLTTLISVPVIIVVLIIAFLLYKSSNKKGLR